MTAQGRQSFSAAFTFACHSRREPLSHPAQRCGNRKRPNASIPRHCRSQSCKPVRFPPSLAAQAAAAPPQQAQRRRFTAHGSVSLRRCPCFLPSPSRPTNENPTQCSGVENGGSTQPQAAAAASPTSLLVLPLPCSPGSRSHPAAGAAPPFHFTFVPFHFGAAPAFLPCFHQRNRFPRPGLSHPVEEWLHIPTHPFQRCEKQPQSPQAKAPDAS